MDSHASEVARGERFEFGENWARFLGVLDERRILEAERSLRDFLGVPDLKGRRFLDAGSGSGLFSLAARRLGARVLSFDFDPRSAACTRELRRRYFPEDGEWAVEEGSVLDRGYLSSLGTFDVVYSWGVLHHTGDMWSALDNVLLPLADGGRLYVALYNDQGPLSAAWRAIKRGYNVLPGPLRLPYAVLVQVPRELKSIAGALVRLDPMRYVRSWTHYGGGRGMSKWHDAVDWIGGYPFETASPAEVERFYGERGLRLLKLKGVGRASGCNEFLFGKGG